MKYLYLLLWAPMALGQSGGTCYTRPAGDGCNTETVCGDMAVSVTAMYCGPVKLGPSAPAPPPTINLDLNCDAALCVGSDGKSRNGLPTPTIDERGCKHYEFSMNGVQIEGVDCPTQEPIDVPAIQEPYSSRPEVKESEVCPFPIEGRWVSECKDIATGVNRQVQHYNDLIKSLRSFTTCADKSRILMHSEDGKYWCHKPQTESPALWPCPHLAYG